MRFDEKTVTVNHHDYLLSGYDYSDYYKVDIIPDYYMFEDGMACTASVACYDMGDTIDVYYAVYITPKGKNKSKVVLDEQETIDKEDFDYINDSVFVMICEWIDNRYGKELFELKKTTKRSLKESLDKWTTSTLRGELMKLGYYIDDLHNLPSKRHANEVIRQAETVKDFCESVIYELTKAIKNNEV